MTEVKHDLKTALREIWTGVASKSLYLRYFSFVLGIYFLGIIGGAAVYPGGFSMLTVYVSYLGGNPNNLPGYIFYNTCVILTGILLVPHFVIMYRRLQPTFKFINIIAAVFGIIGILGYGSIGIWHQGTPGEGHSITTWFAFGGLGASAFFMLWVFIARIVKKQGWPKLWQVLVIYGCMFGLLVIITLFTSDTTLFVGWDIDPAFFEDRFWEWFYVLVVVIWVIGIILLTPKDWKP